MVADPQLLLDDQRQQVALAEDVEQTLGVAGDDELIVSDRNSLSHRDSSVAATSAPEASPPAMPKVRAHASGLTTSPTLAWYSA